MWKKGNHCALLVGMQTGMATGESSMEVPPKIKNGSALCPRNFTSWNISEEIQNTNSKQYMHLYVHCSVNYNSYDMKAIRVPMNRQVDKKKVVF